MHASQFEGSFCPDAASTSRSTASFAELFKSLRKQLVGKQACLSRAGLRCTDAAISHWERGLRLPRPKTMRNAVHVLTELGAAPDDIERLISAWNAEYASKKVVARNRFSVELNTTSCQG
jgi:transcriptional regulator with XRE-family HTH domain